MKKTVKSLIVAASVAAIAGIGAVSFAAWSGGSVESKTAGTGTGHIETTAGTLTATSDLATASKKLVPYNQVKQFDASTMGKVEVITVGYTGGADVQYMNITMTLTANAIATDGSKLMYKLEEVSEAPSDTNGWTDLTLNTAVTLSSAASQKISIILVSDNTDDMDKSYTITFAAAEKTA
ncbi:MAG: hypothetical protein J1F69_03595 [Clostridiales bacterium]|nr:hypothetical protein [Clostridiales bacterium]